MGGETVNRTRRRDLQAALRRAKPDDMLTLEELALIWGVTKPRFVTVRNTMADFPAPLPGQGNVYIYPARKALGAMLKHETRHDEAAKQRRDRANAILGRGGKGKVDDLGSHSPNELATLNRIATEIEERERTQRIYIPAGEVGAVAGDIFGEISEFMSTLDNQVDPNGLLDPEVRGTILDAGKEALLRFHRRMKDMLSLDADSAPSGSKASGRASGGARKPRARRKREGGMGLEAQ